MNRRIIIITSLLATVGLTGPGATQGSADAPPPPGMPKDLPMQSALWDAEQLVTTSNAHVMEIARMLTDRGYLVRADQKIMVEIVGPEGAPAVSPALIASMGGEIRRTWRHRTAAWIPADRLVETAEALPSGYVMYAVGRPATDDVTGEGPAVIGSAPYRDAGADGSGKVIAIIDSSFDNMTEARANGDAPPLARTTIVNLTSDPLEDPSRGTHGTGCVEAAYDHAPGATWRLYMIDNTTDLGNAIDDAIDNGVDVISQSISWYNKGWDDNSGAACAAAQEAAENGILFFTSAGNRAETHHQAVFNDPDGDNWHNFSGGDESIDISEPDSASTTFYLSWDTSGGTFDYDLYLYDATETVILGSSTSGGNTFEQIDWSTTSASSQTVKLRLFRWSGGTTEFEIFEHKAGNWLEHEVAPGSTTSPSNATHQNVLSVAAVHWNSFGSPSGTMGINMSYSSQGPSNNGTTVPDLASPTETIGLTYPGGFGGTSCATPNAAGAAVAFWSSQPALNALAVRWLLQEKAEIFKDWGVGGDDDIFGRGGVTLYPYQANTTWVDRRLNNAVGSASLPYYLLTHAQTVTPSGGRIVFLGQTYPEPITLTKSLTYRSIGWTATVGTAASGREGDVAVVQTPVVSD